MSGDERETGRADTAAGWAGTGAGTGPHRQPANAAPAGARQRDADRVAHAARQAALRAREAQREPEPSLGARLGQVGILGWTIVAPTLLGLALGRWLDRRFGTGVFFAAPLLMIGAAIGLWSAWKWMHRQTQRKTP